VTATHGTPESRDADAAGSDTVAEASTNTGSAPYLAATRRSLRSSSATCDPNTPRYPWHSSTTTYVSRRKNDAQREWAGRIPRCSMSGFVNTHLACARTQSRSGMAVSPSNDAGRTSSTSRARTARSWSAPSAFVGDRYSAVARRSADRALSTGSW
jgi:hypothetical protein